MRNVIVIAMLMLVACGGIEMAPTGPLGKDVEESVRLFVREEVLPMKADLVAFEAGQVMDLEQLEEQLVPQGVLVHWPDLRDVAGVDKENDRDLLRYIKSAAEEISPGAAVAPRPLKGVSGQVKGEVN